MKVNSRLNVYKNNELVFQSFGEFYKSYSSMAWLWAKEFLTAGCTYEIVKVKEVR